jgi:hypothetical protein
MSTTLPLVNEDTVPVILARAGTPLKGDGQLHLMAGMPLRIHDLATEATVTTSVTNVGFVDGDVTRIIAHLHNNRATKESAARK